MAVEKQLRADARRNRDAIVAAARAAFERGEYDLRFDDFAPLASVGTGTLYRHFPNREMLAEAVYRDEIASFDADSTRMLATMPAREALETFVRHVRDRSLGDEGLARSLGALMARREEAQVEGGIALQSSIGRLLDAAIADGSVRPDTRAGSIVVALHAVGAAAGSAASRADASGMIELLLAGLRVEPARE